MDKMKDSPQHITSFDMCSIEDDDQAKWLMSVSVIRSASMTIKFENQDRHQHHYIESDQVEKLARKINKTDGKRF